LLAQLTFNSSIAVDLLNSKSIITRLDNMIEKNNIKFENPNDKFVNESILLEIQKIKWNLNTINKTLRQEKTSDEHIMISYNTESREMVLNLKKQLDMFGYKVWIDVNG
jgi:hypothetical protein